MQNGNKKEQLSQMTLKPGDAAPQFEAESTYGIIRLDDFKDKWVLLFSQPTDFCPTWANEIKKFADHFCELRNMNCELIGIGGTGLQSPLMWSKAVQDEFGVKIWFPVILDPKHQLAKIYGMVDPDDHAGGIKRSVYIIDNNQVLRSIAYYDPANPETIHEIVKLVRLLQDTTACGIVTPENWRPGDEWILKRSEEDDMVKNSKQEMWYF